MGKESTIGYLNHRLSTFSDGGVELVVPLFED